MTRRTKWFVAFALILAGVVAGAFLSAPREPRYEGRLLGAWVADLSSNNYETQRLARVALLDIGPAAVPFLTNSLAQRNSVGVRIFRRNILPRGVVNWTRHFIRWQTPITESGNAARALQILGAQGTNAIPALVPALGDPSYQIAQAAAIALISMGSNAIPALNERLLKAGGNELSILLQIIPTLGTNGGPLAPAVARLVESGDVGVAANASLALGRMGETAIPSAVPLLASTNPTVRLRALSILAQIGPPASCATNAIISIAKSDDNRLRLEAMRALGATLPPRQIGEPLWVAGLKDPDPRVVELSARQLTLFPASIRAFNHELALLALHSTNNVSEIASNALSRFNAWPKE
jgi:hypothetical protein